MNILQYHSNATQSEPYVAFFVWIRNFHISSFALSPINLLFCHALKGVTDLRVSGTSVQNKIIIFVDLLCMIFFKLEKLNWMNAFGNKWILFKLNLNISFFNNQLDYLKHHGRIFLAVHNSSIGLIVTCLVGWLGTTNNQRVHNTIEWP